MTTRLKCVLLEDEIPALAYLKILCEQIAELEVVKAFTDPTQFLKECGALDFELCILDIHMPGANGIQIARLLRTRFVIFTTAFREYAADAFDLDAVDFVSKPIGKERLRTAIQKVIDRKKQKDREKHTILLNTDKGKTLVNPSDIAYLTISEVDSRDKVALMLDGSSLVLKNISFESLQSLLPAREFCRVSKKHLISMKIVVSYTFEEITTNFIRAGNAVKIPLSETYKRQFQDALNQVS